MFARRETNPMHGSNFSLKRHIKVTFRNISFCFFFYLRCPSDITFDFLEQTFFQNKLKHKHITYKGIIKAQNLDICYYWIEFLSFCIKSITLTQLTSLSAEFESGSHVSFTSCSELLSYTIVFIYCLICNQHYDFLFEFAIKQT